MYIIMYIRPTRNPHDLNATSRADAAREDRIGDVFPTHAQLCLFTHLFYSFTPVLPQQRLPSEIGLVTNPSQALVPPQQYQYIEYTRGCCLTR